MSENIILCGFMGSGKSSIGRRLAAKTNRQFIDLDRYIQEKTNKTISEIFRDEGEEAFRQMETEAVRELASQSDCIIAAGGGTVLREINVNLFREGGGKIIFLDVPLPALCERLKNDKQRPLLQVENRREVIETLYNKRIDLYRAAADIVFYAGHPAKYAAKLLAEDITAGRI